MYISILHSYLHIKTFLAGPYIETPDTHAKQNRLHSVGDGHSMQRLFDSSQVHSPFNHHPNHLSQVLSNPIQFKSFQPSSKFSQFIPHPSHFNIIQVLSTINQVKSSITIQVKSLLSSSKSSPFNHHPSHVLTTTIQVESCQ